MHPVQWRSDRTNIIPPIAARDFAVNEMKREPDLTTFRGAYHEGRPGGEWFFRLKGGAHTYQLNHDGREWTVSRFTAAQPEANTSPDILAGTAKNEPANIAKVRIAE